MFDRDKIEQSITRSVNSLSRAIRKQIYGWMADDVELEDIVRRLNAFKLPPAEQAKLVDVIKTDMVEIAAAKNAIARDAGLSVLKTNDINSMMAASKISVPKIKSDIRRYLQKEVRAAAASGSGPEGLRKRLNDYEFGDTKTLANTAIAQFNNNLTFLQADESGMDEFLYYGPVSDTTRPFCRERAGKVFTLAEIEKMDNGQGLPVRESLGGYNCRHSFEIYIRNGK